jgi:predicted adenylyl cyclase CyaB
MAFDNKEVEIKLAVDATSFARIQVWLDEHATKQGAKHQVDTYYTPPDRDFMGETYPFEWLSIRRRGEKAFVNYKHFYPEHEQIHVYGDEFETVVEDPEKMTKIFQALQMRELVTVDKMRTTYILENVFEIAMDEVVHLGRFVEIEALKDFGGIEATRTALAEVATRLGLAGAPVDERGYVYHLYHLLEQEKNTKRDH